MLHLQQLELLQFRNYTQRRLQFPKRITAICGSNGSGKTNLLDAAYYCCFSRSYFTRPEQTNVLHGAQGMRIEGIFNNGTQDYSVCAIIRETGKKELLLNGEPYKQFSQHIGRFPCVMIAPDDISLINEGGEARRKFIDTILSQTDAVYLQSLMVYQKLLQQRNSLLKQLQEQKGSMEVLDILSDQLSEQGQLIFDKRRSFITALKENVLRFYQQIAQADDGLQIQYQSQLHNGPMRERMQQSLQKDLILQRTTTGIHRDDLELKMDEQAFKTEASQGQRKSLLFALKLAEWQWLKQAKGFAPLLLLDDVFEKLDATRMHQLLEWVCTESESQVLITDTHKDRLEAHLSEIGTDYAIIQL